MRTNAVPVMLALAFISALAVTFARAQKSGGANSLSGTSWQLVKLQGPGEQTFAPEDKLKYTIPCSYLVWPAADTTNSSYAERGN